ncbi:MAG: biotin--[acetyl-CoA-carboxylase] ligase [Proteobacteria bacterium]|nr:MAG: biotin--[acetyl-CoA-carboxylase] ligase [Pseudomonadota bacterium]
MTENPKRLSDWEEEILSAPHSATGSPAGRIQLNVRCYDSVASTMDQARKELERSDCALPMLVLAAEQTSGRGRQGRQWVDSGDSFLGTFIFKCDQPVAKLAGLPLMVGCVLHDLFASYGAETALKWPNDVLSPDGRKLSGILVEVVSKHQETYVLIGVGVNLLSFPQKVALAVSLFDLCGRRVVSPQMARDLWPLLSPAWDSFVRSGFVLFKEKFLGHCLYLNQEISIKFSETDINMGIFGGISDQGSLLLRTKDGVKEIAAGDLLPQ